MYPTTPLSSSAKTPIVLPFISKSVITGGFFSTGFSFGAQPLKEVLSLKQQLHEFFLNQSSLDS
jgi:hypothetical protein